MHRSGNTLGYATCLWSVLAPSAKHTLELQKLIKIVGRIQKRKKSYMYAYGHNVVILLLEGKFQSLMLTRRAAQR